MARLAVNMDTLEECRNDQQWGVFAETIGINGGTLSRIRHGLSQPGPAFIANFLAAYPVRMEDLVIVVEDAA